jgi:hypothetical protein
MGEICCNARENLMTKKTLLKLTGYIGAILLLINLAGCGANF